MADKISITLGIQMPLVGLSAMIIALLIQKNLQTMLSLNPIWVFSSSQQMERNSMFLALCKKDFYLA